MKETKKPINPTDQPARDQAQKILQNARHGALGVIDPANGMPLVTKIAVCLWQPARPIILVSDLSMHTKALRGDSRFSLLIEESGGRGDPMNHPRLTLQGRSDFIPRSGDAHACARQVFLRHHPKAKLYIDFADFNLVQLDIEIAHLNGGFGKAYRLGPMDLTPDAGAS